MNGSRVHPRLVVLLVVAFAFALSASAAAAPMQLNFWSLLGGGDGQIMNELVDRFNEEHEHIQVEHTILDWGDPYYSRLITATVGGSPPEIGIMHASRIFSFMSQGLLTPFTDRELEIIGVTEADFMPNIWQAALYEGLPYAIPLDIHPYALYLNVDMMEQAGLPVRSPSTESEFLEFARVLTRDLNADGVPDIAGFSGYGSREWLGYLYQYGGQIMDENRQPAFNNDAGLRALEFQREVIQATADTWFGWFGDQTAAMQLLGPWEIGNFTRLDINFAVDLAPQVGPEYGTWAGSHMLVVPTGIKEQDPERYEATLEFISWLSLNTIEWSAGAGHVPARVDRLTIDSFLELEHQQPFAESLPFAQFWPDHRLEGEFHGQAIAPYLNDEFSLGEAMERLLDAYRQVMFE